MRRVNHALMQDSLWVGAPAPTDAAVRQQVLVRSRNFLHPVPCAAPILDALAPRSLRLIVAWIRRPLASDDHEQTPCFSFWQDFPIENLAEFGESDPMDWGTRHA